VSIDPLLVRIVETLVEELGDTARRERAGRFAAPVCDWSNRDVIDFIDRLRAVTGDEHMGLGAAPCAVGAYEFAIELGARCETLRDAIVMGFRFWSLASGALRYELAEADGAAAITIRQAQSPRDPGRVLADWAMIVWHKLPQWLIGAGIWLERTEFDHPLDAPYSSYAAMFGGRCVFNSDACRLVFASAYLDQSVIRRPSQGDQLKATTPGYFSRPAFAAESWKQRILDILRADIARGEPPRTIDDLAAQFGASSQTLRRRLKGEGTSFRALKAESRLERARDVLGGEAATLGEASLAAGFAEPGALARALRASGGPSSREIREEMLGWRAPRPTSKPPRRP
jgi:AraC-like DNA-binding protein